MKVLVNALSVTNPSGKHVLLGHFSRLAVWTEKEHQYVILHHQGNKDICRELGPNVQWVQCPEYTSGWLGRFFWEYFKLPGLADHLQTDIYFTPAGTVCPTLSIPQVSFAQNPWALVSGLNRTPLEQIKAVLQRKAYRTAMHKAQLMVFNSTYMREAYRRNAGLRESASEIVYQGIDDETFATAEKYRNKPRKNNQVLCVSIMAPHKGIETVIQGIHLTRQKYKIDANLIIIGKWPDKAYEEKIRKLISNLGLNDVVNIRGYVPRDELRKAYAESKVFCLMSHCESFGIPAVEAQTFGTPVVSSNCCAIPEICGKGGAFPDEDDVDEVASQINRLLTDKQYWDDLSMKARTNAERFRWDICSTGLLKML